MRFVETLSDSVEDRFTATTKKELHKKVANSEKSAYKGYPDETGFVPYLVVDPEHNTKVGIQSNICYHKNSTKSTVYTACLAFPHLEISKNSRCGFTIKKLTEHANVNAYDVLDEQTSKTKEVIRERERLRMNAIKDGHEYNISENKKLTSDMDEKIIINAYRSANKRVDNPTVSDVKDVISYERNKYERFMSVSLDSLTEEYVQNIISNKTCSPVIPSNENQKEVLMYWIDNPNAGLSEVIEETGISRGKFETFRLNLPDVSCYNRYYIDSLSFDTDSIINKLHRYMKSSPHPVYSCSLCDSWSYSKVSLASHKTHSNDHDENCVTEEETPTKPENPNNIQIQWESTSVDKMLDVFEQSETVS